MTSTLSGDDALSDCNDSTASSAKQSQGMDSSLQFPMAMQSSRGKSFEHGEGSDHIQAYAMLDFENFTFYVQTMQILLGRLVEGDTSTDSLDIHLGQQKAISRRHAKIFYNFGNQRFELSVVGRNGAFVDDMFVENGVTLPLKDKTRIQIGETRFMFILPTDETVTDSKNGKQIKPINPSDAVSLKTSFSNNHATSSGSSREGSSTPQHPKVNDNKSSTVLKLGDDFVNELRANAEASVVKREEAAAAAAAARNGNQVSLMDGVNALSAAGRAQQSLQSAKDKLKKPLKAVKKVYKPEEIPEEYRTKPNFSYSTLIAECLRQKGTERGMSLSEIYKGIQELYPYYYYCPDGWQSSVRHNLSLNKSFRKVCKEGKGWLWGLDEEYFAEKERLKRKQIELANIKATQHLQTLSQQFQQQPARPESYSSSSSPAPESNSSESSNSKLSGDTKKALSYLQQELIRLTKDRKMYDKETTTQILTQALAMTIAQVNQAAKNAGIQGFPLVTLIDKNPAHITKILSAALNAATIQVTKKKGLPPPSNSPAPPVSKPVEPAPTRSNIQQFARPSPPVPKPLATSGSIKSISSAQAGIASTSPGPSSSSPIPSIRKPQYYGKPLSVAPSSSRSINKPVQQKQSQYDNESIQLQFQKFSQPTPPVAPVAKPKSDLEDLDMKLMLDSMDHDKDTSKELDLDKFLAQHSGEVELDSKKRPLDSSDSTKDQEPDPKSSKIE